MSYSLNAANGACTQGLSLMRCRVGGGDIEEQATLQQGLRLCAEGPDGEEDCDKLPGGTVSVVPDNIEIPDSYSICSTGKKVHGASFRIS